MASIRIKSIGPIKDTGIVELRTINLFIGKQSTGKSTLLKILSHCRWIEKVISTGSHKHGRTALYDYTHNYRFINELIKFYRFDQDYFGPDSEISYHGDTYVIEFKGNHNSNPRIEAVDGAEPYNAKLCFIPSERNLISAIRDIESWYKPKEFDLLFNFIFEWDVVRENYKPSEPLHLTVTPDMEFFYEKGKGERVRIIGKQKEFSPFYASSGVQSALPLEGMLNSLTRAVGSKANLSKSDLIDIVSSILQDGADFNKPSIENRLAKNLLTYQGAVFFVEEPEQNLFPESQANLMRHMAAAIKEADSKFEGHRSMLSITTHSPYILSALNVLMAASEAYAINPAATVGVVPERYILPQGSISAYHLTDDGEATDIIDPDIYMVSGASLDGISQQVEDELDRLNDIICQ